MAQGELKSFVQNSRPNPKSPTVSPFRLVSHFLLLTIVSDMIPRKKDWILRNDL